MIEPARLDLIISSGSTFRRVVEWLDADGDPVSMFGFTGRFVIQRGSQLIYEDDAIVAGIPATNEVEVTVAADDTALLSGAYQYALYVTNSGATITTKLLYGTLRAI